MSLACDWPFTRLGLEKTAVSASTSWCVCKVTVLQQAVAEHGVWNWTWCLQGALFDKGHGAHLSMVSDIGHAAEKPS